MKRNLITVLVLSLAASMARADVTLPAVLGSHMVLQRDRPIPIWGKADVGESVVVRLGKKEMKTEANDRGTWMVTFPKMKVSKKPLRLTVEGKNKIELQDVTAFLSESIAKQM